MLSLFRKIAHWEGISLLVLLFIAMPLKYFGGHPEYVRIIGMIHGILFIAFVVLAIMVKNEKSWNMTLFVFCLIASILPFGTFYLDAKFLKKYEKL